MSAIRIMVVDDSVLVRGLLRRILTAEADFEIVASCGDGEAAVQAYSSAVPDIVLMDIEMPRMNGLEALKHIRSMDGDARVVMCSSLTREGAEATLLALEAGAIDYLSKPSAQSVDEGLPFEQALIGKIRALNKRQGRTQPETALEAGLPQLYMETAPAIIAIGCSTGGPKALTQLLNQWVSPVICPVLITQHIPVGFSAQLAKNLHKNTGFPVYEAQDGQVLENGHFYLAPGGRHLTLENGDGNKRIRLSDAPAVNFCKPSVDVMLDSVLAAYERNILTIILTGMGNDGRTGCTALRRHSADNIVLVQDEESSVVWGMPGAVARAQLAHEVLPLDKLAASINRLLLHKEGAS